MTLYIIISFRFSRFYCDGYPHSIRETGEKSKCEIKKRVKNRDLRRGPADTERAVLRRPTCARSEYFLRLTGQTRRVATGAAVTACFAALPARKIYYIFIVLTSAERLPVLLFRKRKKKNVGTQIRKKKKIN